MTHTDSQKKPLGKRFGKCFLSGLHRRRGAGMDRGNTGGNNETLRRRQEQCGRGEWLATYCFRNPQCVETERFKFGRGFLRFGHRLGIECERPNTHLA